MRMRWLGEKMGYIKPGVGVDCISRREEKLCHPMRPEPGILAPCCPPLTERGGGQLWVNRTSPSQQPRGGWDPV